MSDGRLTFHTTKNGVLLILVLRSQDLYVRGGLFNGASGVNGDAIPFLSDRLTEAAIALARVPCEGNC